MAQSTEAGAAETLSRSGVTRDADPESVGRDTDGTKAVPPLFQPFAVRSVTFKNRIVVTPMCQYCADEGHITPWHMAHHGRFALGGVGGAVVEATGITRDGRITPGCLGIWQDSHIEGLKAVTRLYHDQGTPVGIQIGHAGRKGSAAVPLEGARPLVETVPDQAWQTVAPSAIPLTADWPTPRALESAEIEALLAEFGHAAARAVAAGFDFIEVHGAHGYLIHSFFSPLSNHRSDAWGGDLAGRMRFAVEAVKAVRRVVPSDMPVFYRTSAVDSEDGSVTIEDTVALAKALKAQGVDVLDCSAGGITGASGRAKAPPAPGYLVPYAHTVRADADMPTMAVGLILEPEQAQRVVTDGSADLVALGRELIANPNFAYHAAIALGHPAPHTVLPESYAFFLSRRHIGKKTG
ncbi:NADH:flavin oxidoreductase/NADH oxidase [Eilatimonas milleporae]|uniref:2,4-dienoyl-CoA reductase-like NADH-dependent reductase (Old Yellow Enzyme family) n=1 Tax=Eilatimonas milleporae TaxID=911205 RepID=A0A3M0CUC2_9PROT|nr:NADH:flavin oxidoreductase/NADH oxidase [Eilatimonas milleporae]RMB12090.1 2,4-dienoyl-CoA reductase-like NADH-dependent reductase (Old Yellow Enzyme family) [Eilatimonas milleporae]